MKALDAVLIYGLAERGLFAALLLNSNLQAVWLEPLRSAIQDNCRTNSMVVALDLAQVSRILYQDGVLPEHLHA